MNNFRKTCISIVSGVCLLSFGHLAQTATTTATATAAMAEGTMKTLGDKINVRVEAKTTAKAVGTLDKSVAVTVMGRSKEPQTIDKVVDYWYQVRTADGKTTGWVFGGLLTETGAGMTLGEGVMVRSTASKTGSQVEKLAKQTTVEILDRTKQREVIGKANDYWYQVKTEDDKMGWVFGGFLMKTGPRVTTGDKVNVRAEPKTSATVVETLAKGAIVSVSERTKEQVKVGTVEDYWYKVDTEGKKTGWVFGQFLMAVEVDE